MSDILNKNADYSAKMKELLRLRYEPVAVKLMKDGEEYPDCCQEASQMAHCQAVFRAKGGDCIAMPFEMHACHVGASALGMTETPEKVVSGDFHAGIGIHDSPSAASKMVADRLIVPGHYTGEVVCPLSKADFVPDVVILVDIPERIYWVAPLQTAEEGGRVQYSTSPFQAACEDLTAVPIVTGKPNISLGCFGCRKKTDMKADELAVGIPYANIAGYVEHLSRYESGPLAKAKRE